MKRPTQSDVARLAGVSRATVSYVISGHANGAIALTEETRRRVLQAAEQLGYQPHAAAQSLRAGATHTIGMLIPDMRNPHYWQIVCGVEEVARAHGYDLLLSHAALNPDRELESVNALLRGRVDGLALILTFPDRLTEEAKLLAQRRSPVVLFSEGIAGLDMVLPGHGEGAVEMMAHLLALGHRRIGLVYGVAIPELARDRLGAYRRALQEAGLPLSEELIEYCGPTLADGYKAAARLLDRPPRPTALLAVNDLLAVGVLRLLADRGLRVPEDVSVAGFDDIDVASYLVPPLTTVRVNAEEVGRTAGRLIFERMNDPERPLQSIRIPAELVKRTSTGPAPKE
jgi:LacI family transcriptional regulator